MTNKELQAKIIDYADRQLVPVFTVDELCYMFSERHSEICFAVACLYDRQIIDLDNGKKRTYRLVRKNARALGYELENKEA